MMGTERHRIQNQRVRVDVESEALAMALQARLPQLNRTRFLEVIERVIDECVKPGQHIRIASLKIDLGTIPFTGEFEQVAIARLERELRDALQQAVRAAESRPTPTQFAQSADQARLELLEHYLRNGTVPFWAAVSDFNLDAVMAEAASSSPDGLVRLLTRSGGDTLPIERLVHQLSEAGLRRLLQLLDPGNAARIILDLTELLEERELASLLPAGDEPARRLLWLQVLTYELRERNAPFDAATMVESPLEGTAGDTDTSRAGPSLLADVSAAVPADATVAMTGVEVAAAHDAAAAVLTFARYDRADILRYYLRYGALPWSSALARVASGESPLTIQAVLDTLPGLPLPLLGSIFPTESPEERLAAVLRAVREMSGETLARLLAALFTDAVRPAVVAGLSADVERGPDRHAAYARAIVRLLDRRRGEGGELEASPAVVPPAVVPPAAEEPSQWEVHLLKSVLVERVRTGGLAGPNEPSSATLLQILIERHPADAVHFFRVLRNAGVRLSLLLSDAASLRLIGRSLTLIPSPAAGLTIALFGPTISSALHQRLIAETEHLAVAGGLAPDSVAAIRVALLPLAEPAIVEQRPRSAAHHLPSRGARSHGSRCWSRGALIGSPASDAARGHADRSGALLPRDARGGHPPFGTAVRATSAAPVRAQPPGAAIRGARQRGAPAADPLGAARRRQAGHRCGHARHDRGRRAQSGR